MIGEKIGNYKILSLLGAGGMGEVYLAEQVAIETRVAIKILQTQISKDADQVQRFFNEARAVSKVRHAGTVKIFDVGFHQAHAYLVMEYLDGESLAARIRRLGTLPGEQVAEIGRQIAGVLDAVHTVGVTHRDLKPDNIFLVPDHELASGERVKVLDFGIAKLSGTMSGHSPQTKGTMGTPAYMAPEQWNNAASVDGRADTYSLGCVMFEMAVGKPPFPSGSIGEACTHHLHSKPPRASELVPQVPPEFDTLVDRMLSKTVDLRPTIKEIARAFDDLRSSGATQRWYAQKSLGMAATLAPTSPPRPGAQAVTTPSSYAPVAVTTPLPLPQAFAPRGHMTTPQPHPADVGPSSQHQAQSGSAPYLPQQGTPPHPPQGSAPYLPPQYPQGSAPYITPQHPPAMQPARSSKAGLVIGVSAGVVVAGGIAAAVILSQGDTGDAGSADGGTGNAIRGVAALPDAQRVVEIDAEPSLREHLAATNPFVDAGGVRVLSSQVTVRDYKLVMGTLPAQLGGVEDAPAAWLTQQEAAAFCAAIDARLPTSDEWARASRGEWAIAVGAVTGPLQEWTSTIQDELVVVRGGHSQMSKDQLARAARQAPPYFLQKDSGDGSADRKAVAGATIGFRCVDGTAPPKDTSTGSTVGSHAGSGPARGNPRPAVKIGTPAATGDLDKALIRRGIKQKIQNVRSCYEKALVKQPTLQGTVMVQFTIGPSGTVVSAQATGLDPAVSTCVANVVKQMTFPKPTGGGVVNVNYPFAFRPVD
jgi:serine/threonine-protein kinase